MIQITGLIEIQKVIGLALKKKPEARYQSAQEMASDLKHYHYQLQAEESGLFNLRTLLRRLKQPRVAIPAVLGLSIIVAAAFWFFNRQAKIRWAREVALPEIERLIEENDVWRNLVPPFRLAEKVEAIIPRDAKLAEIFSKCSLADDFELGHRTSLADCSLARI